LGNDISLFASVASVAAQYPGWLIPTGGRDEKSPIAPKDEVWAVVEYLKVLRTPKR
jgi:hypothetical protein